MVSNCPESDRRVRQLTFRKQWELSEEELSKLKNIYIACALCVDDQISEVISSLKSEGMYKSTLLMITADHGEMFGEMEVPGGKPFGHPGYLVEEQAAVPFIIAGGGVPSGSLDSLVSTMDIAPTLIDLFNHTQPDSWRGTVIGGPRFTEREYVISVTETKEDDGDMPKGTLHVSIRTDELAVLWWGHHSQPIEAYKLTDNGCGEIKIQAPTEHETCIQLREMIKSRFSAAAARSLSRSTEIDPGEEISNRLRDLGYIE
jgi:arylsulfatase